MKFIDPNGLDKDDIDPGAEGKDPERKKRKAPQRIIYLFVGFQRSEQRTYELDRYHQETSRGTAPPDFAGLQAQAKKQGVDLRVFTGLDVNRENLTKALQDASAYAVIFIGHGATSPDQEGLAPYIPNQGVGTTDGPSNPDGAIDVNAQNVAVFTCESEFASTLLTPGNGNQSFIGVYSGATFGTEGLTQFGTLSRMGFGAAKQFVTGKGPDAAVAAANRALKAPPMIGRQRLTNPIIDAGDYAQRIR